MMSTLYSYALYVCKPHLVKSALTIIYKQTKITPAYA